LFQAGKFVPICYAAIAKTMPLCCDNTPVAAFREWVQDKEIHKDR
jgi:hypothetical protein